MPSFSAVPCLIVTPSRLVREQIAEETRACRCWCDSPRYPAEIARPHVASVGERITTRTLEGITSLRCGCRNCAEH